MFLKRNSKTDKDCKISNSVFYVEVPYLEKLTKSKSLESIFPLKSIYLESSTKSKAPPSPFRESKRGVRFSLPNNIPPDNIKSFKPSINETTFETSDILPLKVKPSPFERLPADINFKYSGGQYYATPPQKKHSGYNDYQPAPRGISESQSFPKVSYRRRGSLPQSNQLESVFEASIEKIELKNKKNGETSFPPSTRQEFPFKGQSQSHLVSPEPTVPSAAYFSRRRGSLPTSDQLQSVFNRSVKKVNGVEQFSSSTRQEFPFKGQSCSQFYNDLPGQSPIMNSDGCYDTSNSPCVSPRLSHRRPSLPSAPPESLLQYDPVDHLNGTGMRNRSASLQLIYEEEKSGEFYNRRHSKDLELLSSSWRYSVGGKINNLDKTEKVSNLSDGSKSLRSNARKHRNSINFGVDQQSLLTSQSYPNARQARRRGSLPNSDQLQSVFEGSLKQAELKKINGETNFPSSTRQEFPFTGKSRSHFYDNPPGHYPVMNSDGCYDSYTPTRSSPKLSPRPSPRPSRSQFFIDPLVQHLQDSPPTAPSQFTDQVLTSLATSPLPHYNRTVSEDVFIASGCWDVGDESLEFESLVLEVGVQDNWQLPHITCTLIFVTSN